jgi:hypothetical protein
MPACLPHSDIMQNASSHSCSSSPVRNRLVGLAFLTAISLVTAAVASAEPRVLPDAGVAVPESHPAGAERALTSLSPEADAGGCTVSSRRDKQCPWGRVGDGQGKLLRCLSEDESREVAKSAKAGKVAGTSKQAVPSAGPSAVAAVVNGVVFEGENIASAKGNLASAVTDYQNCVAGHGGLRHGAGDVRIRFHIDARGLARDASISRRRFISVRAAQCVAEIVEHRFVGVPKSKASIGTAVIHFERNAR